MPIIRSLTPIDAARLAAHLKRLDANERRLRFFSCSTDMAIDAHVESIDWLKSLHIAILDDGDIRGVASLAWEKLWPETAEFAISLETPWQGRGIGGELTRRILTVARNRGIAQVNMICLAGNAPMRAIAKRHTSILKLEDGEIAGRLGLAQADPLSFWQEAAATVEGLLGAMPIKAAR